MWASEAAAGRRAALRAAVGWQGHCATATTPATSLASNAITRGSSSGSSCEHRIGVGLGSGSSGGGAPSRRCLDVVFSGGDDAVGTRGASSTAGQPTGDRTSSSAVWPSAAWTAQFGGRNGRAQLPARVSPRLPAGATLAATAAAAAPRASPTGASWCLLLHRGLAAPVTKKQQQQQQRENTNPNAIKKKGKPGDAELTPKLARIVEFLLPADQQVGCREAEGREDRGGGGRGKSKEQHTCRGSQTRNRLSFMHVCTRLCAAMFLLHIRTCVLGMGGAVRKVCVRPNVCRC
eukprot:363892-Chlamydomonas_euryale.AAC.7